MTGATVDTPRRIAVVPAYNEEPTVRDVLGKLYTYVDELVVVDDGSTDATRSEIERFLPEHPNARMLVHEVNQGMSEAYYLAFTDLRQRLERGELDADDLILPHAISALHRITADVYGFGIRMSTGANLPSRPVTAEQVLTSPDNLVFSCSPFRRTVWEANRIADMDMEDWWYWIRAAHAGFTFTASRGVDYIYRVHDQNRSNEYDAEQQRDKVRRMRQDLLA